MAWADDAQTRLRVSASYGCSAVMPGLLALGESELELLPVGCADKGARQRGFVAAIDLGG